MDAVDYARLGHAYRAHHQRFVAHVERDGVVCQACRGRGGETIPILDDGTGPFEDCGWCEGTGRVTRWLRGLFLRVMRDEKRKRREREALQVKRGQR